MESLTSAINVQVDAKDKEEATRILKDLGLNMTTFINMAIKQVIKTDGIPFEISNSRVNKELKNAIKESNKIVKDIESGKKEGYTNVRKMFEDILNEE